jgi:hypothetical protein
MSRRRWGPAVALLLLPACSGDNGGAPATDPTAAASATGADVASAPSTAPSTAGSRTLCAAAAAAPMRWLDDAVVTLQLWVDAFAAIDSPPASIAPALERLVAFGDARMRWHLTGDGERPPATAAVAADRRAVVATAVSTCPDLPLAFGPDRSFAPEWTSLPPDELAQRCADDVARVQSAVDEYRTATGAEPGHQAELEEVVVTFFSSDVHGVALDGGTAIVVPVPAGACASG